VRIAVAVGAAPQPPHSAATQTGPHCVQAPPPELLPLLVPPLLDPGPPLPPLLGPPLLDPELLPAQTWLHG